MISFPKVVRSTLLGLTFAGVAGSCANTQAVPFANLIPSTNTAAVPQSVKNFAFIAAFVIPTVSAYIALTQDEQPVLENGTLLEKMVNWYRRVVCGKASKKVQIVQADGEIKDTYTKASGMFGKSITWYDANEKDVKKAAAIGALFTIATLNTDLKDILGNLMKGAPYVEVFKKA